MRITAMQGNLASGNGHLPNTQVMVRSAGNLAPHVALFASEDITAGSELTFAYGAPSGPESAAAAAAGLGRVPRQCLCGLSACLGFMPSDA